MEGHPVTLVALENSLRAGCCRHGFLTTFSPCNVDATPSLHLVRVICVCVYEKERV